jgi:hypothetical protein
MGKEEDEKIAEAATRSHILETLIEIQEILERGSLNRFVNDCPDSIEIGTPSKGGAIKLYGDFLKPEEFKAKIHRAQEVRAEAQKILG